MAYCEIMASTIEANLDMRAGDLKAADRSSAEALEALDLRGSMQGPEEAVLYTRARVLKALGRAQEAQARAHHRPQPSEPDRGPRWRGLWRQQVQMDLTATVQNLRRLAAYVHRRRRGAAAAALVRREAIGARSFYESREIHQFALRCLLVIHLKTVGYRRSARIRFRARRARSSTGF